MFEVTKDEKCIYVVRSGLQSLATYILTPRVSDLPGKLWMNCGLKLAQAPELTIWSKPWAEFWTACSEQIRFLLLYLPIWTPYLNFEVLISGPMWSTQVCSVCLFILDTCTNNSSPYVMPLYQVRDATLYNDVIYSSPCVRSGILCCLFKCIFTPSSGMSKAQYAIGHLKGLRGQTITWSLMSTTEDVKLQPKKWKWHRTLASPITCSNFSTVRFRVFKNIALQTGHVVICVLHLPHTLWPFAQIPTGGWNSSRHVGHASSPRSLCWMSMIYREWKSIDERPSELHLETRPLAPLIPAYVKQICKKLYH